jgi:hypothetical protein
MTGGSGSSSGGGGIGCAVSCGIGGSFHSNSGNGGKCHDDGGMEEVVTWRLFYFDFCCKFTSSGQPCRGVYRDSPIGDNFTVIYGEFSKIGKKLSKI